MQFRLTKSVIATYNGIADSVNAYQVTQARQVSKNYFANWKLEQQKRSPTVSVYLFKKMLRLIIKSSGNQK